MRTPRLRAALTLALAGFPGLAHARAPVPALMPLPAQLVPHDGTLSAAAGLAVSWEGARSALLDRAADRFAAALGRIGGTVTAPPGARPARLVIDCAAPDPGFLSVAAHEHYRLLIDPGGIRLSAEGPAGVLHGLATLRQLAQPGTAGLVFPSVSIDDAPRFVWRGLMIDVSRHFMSLATLRRQIDAMEQVKLDVLHLHLSDSQGFRVESRLFPRLQQVASHGQFYTQREMRDLVAYAGDRGIRVVPEFDLPGHSLALLQAYPQFAATPPDRLPAGFDPNQAAIDPSNPRTLAMAASLLGEMADLFPDRYFHLGGDEVRGAQWTDVPRIAAFMRAHHFGSADLMQADFTARMQRVLAAHHKTTVGWDEVIGAPVPNSVVVQVWRSSKWTARAAAAGHPVIVSAGYYLDLLEPSVTHYAIDPLDPRAVGQSPDLVEAMRAKIGDKADGFARDPAASLSPAQAAHVLGAEAPLWTEIVSDEMLDARLWPRAAALAERFWSPPERRDAQALVARLEPVLDRLDLEGLQAEANRRRMLDRLAPGDTAVLERLLDGVAPDRNYALHEASLSDRSGGTPLRLIDLADAADPDDPPAQRLSDAVQAYLSGDRSEAASIRAALGAWRDNEAPFAARAAQSPVLEAALPASHDLGSLAAAGLQALAILEQGGDPATLAAFDAVLSRTRRALDHANGMDSNVGPQPPGGLLIPAVEPIGRLVDAARHRPAPTTAPKP